MSDHLTETKQCLLPQVQGRRKDHHLYTLLPQIYDSYITHEISNDDPVLPMGKKETEIDRKGEEKKIVSSVFFSQK